MANSFDSPDTVQLKGKSTGVTRLSRKAKLLMLFGLMAVGGFLLFSIMNMDSGDKPTATTEDPEAAAEKKARSVEPATPNLRGIGNGQVGVWAAHASDAVGADAPLIPIDERA